MEEVSRAVASTPSRPYAAAMKLLQQANERRAREREEAREQTRAALHEALARLLPAGTRVWIYGSLAKPGRFAEWSDIDLALEHEPGGRRIYQLMGLLAEATGREVDLAILDETRLREHILREGELWTL